MDKTKTSWRAYFLWTFSGWSQEVKSNMLDFVLLLCCLSLCSKQVSAMGYLKVSQWGQVVVLVFCNTGDGIYHFEELIFRKWESLDLVNAVGKLFKLSGGENKIWICCRLVRCLPGKIWCSNHRWHLLVEFWSPLECWWIHEKVKARKRLLNKWAFFGKGKLTVDLACALCAFFTAVFECSRLFCS